MAPFLYACYSFLNFIPLSQAFVVQNRSFDKKQGHSGVSRQENGILCFPYNE